MFQQDLLETVDDALGRMNKVQDRLGMLKLEVMPEFQDMELCRFLKDLYEQLEKKLKVITIALDCRAGIQRSQGKRLLGAGYCVSKCFHGRSCAGQFG